MEDKKTVCIYHQIDLDGWMSAAIVALWGKNQPPIEFVGYNYGQEIPNLAQYERVIMCDISFPASVMREISRGREVIWIDHHISAIKDVGKEFEEHGLEPLPGMRDTTFAACELTWKYFFPNDEMPEQVRLLGRYDCFGHKGTAEEQLVLEFQYGCNAFVNNWKSAYALLIAPPQAIDEILVDGKAIYKFLRMDAKSVYKSGFTLMLPEGDKMRKFVCMNRGRFNPDNFSIKYSDDGYDGVACFHYDGRFNDWSFSFYTVNKNIDCSVIAKFFGGGGHMGAAGCRIPSIEAFMTRYCVK